jgi:hypothetical protein
LKRFNEFAALGRENLVGSIPAKYLNTRHSASGKRPSHFGAKARTAILFATVMRITGVIYFRHYSSVIVE